MKAHLLALLMLCAISSFALAQTSQGKDTTYRNDPQVSDQNYKHPNKAAAAVESGKDQHVKTGTIKQEDNSNYKQSFKRSSTHKSKVTTDTSGSRTKVKRNYKHQF